MGQTTPPPGHSDHPKAGAVGTSPRHPAATDAALGDRLRRAGVSLTLQRLVIAQVLLARPVHLTADQVWSLARELMPEISRATVYNTLDLFERSNLLRRLIVDTEKVVFDSNVSPHHHLYDITTGEVADLAPGEVKVVGTPVLPPNLELADIDVVVRVRRRDS